MTINLCFTRKDYKEWIFQHESWCFDTKQKKEKEANAANRNESDEDDSDNRIAIIVGTFGEMKGAVQCAQSI